jgi:hypothetical protein
VPPRTNTNGSFEIQESIDEQIRPTLLEKPSFSLFSDDDDDDADDDDDDDDDDNNIERTNFIQLDDSESLPTQSTHVTAPITKTHNSSPEFIVNSNNTQESLNIVNSQENYTNHLNNQFKDKPVEFRPPTKLHLKPSNSLRYTIKQQKSTQIENKYQKSNSYSDFLRLKNDSNFKINFNKQHHKQDEEKEKEDEEEKQIKLVHSIKSNSESNLFKKSSQSSHFRLNSSLNDAEQVESIMRSKTGDEEEAFFDNISKGK